MLTWTCRCSAHRCQDPDAHALGEDELLALPGADEENPTMALPCRTVLAAGQRTVEVSGPYLHAAAAAVHEGFWTGADA